MGGKREASVNSWIKSLSGKLRDELFGLQRAAYRNHYSHFLSACQSPFANAASFVAKRFLVVSAGYLSNLNRSRNQKNAVIKILCVGG